MVLETLQQVDSNQQTRPRTWSDSLPDIVRGNLDKLVFSVPLIRSNAEYQFYVNI
jgi:hypothetical protein